MGMPSFFGFDEPGRDREAEQRAYDAGFAQAGADFAAGLSWEELVAKSVEDGDRDYQHGYKIALSGIAARRDVNFDGYRLHVLTCASLDRKYGRVPS